MKNLYLLAIACMLNIAVLAQTWTNVGSAGFSTGEASYTSLAFDGSGAAYVAFCDYANSNKATVMKYNGSSWVTVGSEGFSGGSVGFTSLAIDSSGTPYVAYRDNVSLKATVMKYDGSTWVTVGSANFSAGQIDHMSLAIDRSGTPYVAYRDDWYGLKATVMKYNGSSWVTVGSADFSAGEAYTPSLAIDGTGTPFVAYSDGPGGYKATVMKYNGSSWVTVGSAGFSAGIAGDPSLAIDGSGTPYVAYSDLGNSYKATIMKFNGSSWETVGSAGFSADTAYCTSLAIDGSGTPYVGYVDNGSSKKSTVMKFNGSSWVAVGGAGFSAGATNLTCLRIGSGTPYMAFMDYANSLKATVMKFGTSISVMTGTASLCAGATTTLSDSTTGGTWSSSNTSVATVGSSNGVVSGVSAGTATISYTVSGSSVAAVVTVNPMPDAGTITGASSVNVGNTITISGTVTGGAWATSNSAVATVGSTGIVAGVATGSVTISYSVTNSCGSAVATKVVSVNAAGTVSCDSWTNVGSAGFSAGAVEYTSLVIDGSGMQYVAYKDGGNSNKATVMKYNGSSWVTVGSAGFSAGSVEYTSLAIGHNDTPYVVYRDVTNSNKATVMKYNGSSWVTVGSAGFSAGATQHNSIAVDSSGTPYVAYQDVANGNKATVKKYNGGNWVTVGSAGFSLGRVTWFSFALDDSGTPYVAYQDIDYGQKATVMKYNGSSWVTVGSADFSAGIVYHTSLAIDGSGTPYVAYMDGANSNKATVMKYSGSSWETVGSAGFSTSNVEYISLALNGSGIPYVAYMDYAQGFHATVMKYNGSSWVAVGSVGFSLGMAYYTSIAMNGSGKPYLAYMDDPISQKATVMTFGSTTIAPITGTTNVCAGATTTLTDATSGGTWSSGNTSVATVGPSSGIVSGVSAGTAVITYGIGGCNVAAIVTVNPAPSVGSITGASSVNVGSAITLSNTTGGGTWSSSNTAIATVSSTGIVNGVATGAVTISCTVTNSCGSAVATKSVSVISSYPFIITTIAGGGTGGDGGIATAASLATPTWIAIDGGGNIFIACYNHTIRKVNPSGVISTIAGTGTAGYSGDGGPATAAQLNLPTSVAVDGSGNVYIADGGNNVIRKINSSGIISTFAGNGYGAGSGAAIGGYSGDGGPATAAKLYNPQGVGTDESGNVYIADEFNHCIRKVNSSGIISTIAGLGPLGYGFTGDGGPATAAKLYYPIGVAVDGGGNIYIVDYFNQRIRKIDSSGVISTIAGSSSTAAGYGGFLGGYSGDGGVATLAELNNPHAVSIDGCGNVYIGDYGNNRIRKINNSGIITTIAGIGTPGFSGDGGSPIAAELQQPTNVAFSSAGNIFICDNINMRIRMIGLPQITGPSSTCVGNAINLADSAADGTWSSSNTSVAIVGSTGIVTGVAMGTATISYGISNSCGTAYATKIITVNALPNAGVITGLSSVCTGNTLTLTDASPEGTWSSSNTSVGTVGSTGVVTGLTGGIVTISYAVSGMCGSAVTSKVLTVNATPSAGTITGASALTVGTTMTLSNTVSGGSWSSSNSNATVSSAGVVSALVAGTATISYTVANSCGSASATKVITVNAAVDGITGSLSVCSGSSTALSCATPGGAWSSNNTTIATVTTGGVVSGLSPGVAVISYTVGGSYVTTMLTVNAQPAEITGSRVLCGGSLTTLASTTTGGTWSSTNISVATISATGIVTGLAAGTTVISYTNASGCARTVVVTVNAQPSAITGATSLCPGTTGTLSNSVSGGTWSGGVTTIATINGGGVVTAINTGMTTISYTTTGSCRATVVITVNAAPANITGTMKACPGTTTTLGDATAGGTWSSGNIAVTAIGSATGIVTGVTAGTAIVSYTTGAGCSKTTIVTINPLPTAISGPLAICVGSTSTLTNGTSGLTWSSNNTSVATIGGTNGILTGVSIGTSVISYKSGTTGCYVTAIATVATTPAAISGPSTACPGSSITLSSTTTGGTWSSGNTGIATVDATTGVVTGVSTGIVTISYSLGSGCSRTKQITINASPTPVSGYPLVCVGLTTTLSSVYGTWASGNPSVATVVISGGYVTGVAPGTALMTFTSSPNGCTATYVVTVMPVPAAITGTTSLCSGLTTTLSDATPGGVWSSSNTAGATVGSATGLVTAVGTGTVTISYSFGNTCRATTAFTTRALPAVISGSDTVCATMTTTLSDVTTGGTWSSSNTAIATVGTGISTGYGVVSGVTAGTAAISYTLTSTGCARSKVVTVNACSRPGGNGQPAGGSWQLYPNPTTGTFTVNADEAGVLQVYSLDGREVSHYVIRKMLNELVLPKELASGVYMCRFTGESGTTTIVRLVYER